MVAPLWEPSECARAATVSIDGPSADIVNTQAVDVDMAPDGTGGIAYLKKGGGVNHVFVSRFVGGAFQAPEQVDTGIATPSRNVVISAANAGRLAVSFLNTATDVSPTGNLDIVFRPSAGQAWTAPVTPLGANASYGSVDLAPGGDGYLAYVINGRPISSALSGSRGPTSASSATSSTRATPTPSKPIRSSDPFGSRRSTTPAAPWWPSPSRTPP